MTVVMDTKRMINFISVSILYFTRNHQAAAAAGVAVVPRLLELQLLVSFPGRRPRHNRKLLLTTTTLAQQQQREKG